MRQAALPLAFLLSLSACWKEELAEIPPDVLQFQPEGLQAPPGWLISPYDVNLECPDGRKTRFYLLYPEELAGSTAPVPAAVVYHSGAYDFVFAPDAERPLEGTHFADPPRLSSEWALRQVFSTLGMYPDQDPSMPQRGDLAVALAEAGLPVILPANCWGDLWHNARGTADNSFEEDLFFRDGRAAADWSYRFLSDPLFASYLDVELPFLVDPNQIYVIGLGEGGRAVAELLSIDTDGDGTPNYSPAGVLVDSTLDDVRFYFNDPSLYGNMVAGLSRIHPQGPSQAESGSLWAAPALPERFGYLYSSADPIYPEITHSALISRLVATQKGWIYVDTAPVHGQLNTGVNPDLARQAVNYLLTGTEPPPGPGEIHTLDTGL